MKITRIFALLALLALPSIAAAKKYESNLDRLLDFDFESGFPSFSSGLRAPSFFSIPNQGSTSGTLTTQTAVNWSTAPWMITAGAGAYPDGGGIATWGTHVNTVIGTVAAGATVTLDVPVTLSGITYNSPFSMTLAGTAVNNLGLSASGATFNVQLSIANTPSLFQLANNITAPITGGGSAGFTKTGNGSMTLGTTVVGGNTYTGGTHINGGILAISTTAAIGDTILGAAGAGNGVSFNGGGLDHQHHRRLDDQP